MKSDLLSVLANDGYKLEIKLDLPIHIFASEYDANTPKFHAFDIDEKFKELRKTNLTLHTFENHDHDLNYLLYILKGELSEGMKAIFETAGDLL